MSQGKPKVYRLQRLAEAIQGLFQRELGDQSFWVRAEIAEISTSSSGHSYLSLVEERDGYRLASLQGVIWKADYEILKSQLNKDLPGLLQRGQELVFRVLVDYHPVYGLKLIIKEIDLSFSLGELEKRRQANLKKLEASGRIEDNRKIPESQVWQRIALISSKEAAAVKDFIQHLQENEFGFRFKVDLFPSKVQGKEAPLSLIKALQSIQYHEYDCIAFVRGGGSSLDLDAFNDLALCYEILNCPIPVLSGIGHESDWTLVDRVAHTAQKTPTAVADHLLDKMAAFEREIGMFYQALARHAKDSLHIESIALKEYANTLKNQPQHFLETQRGFIHQNANGLIRDLSSKLKAQNQDLDKMSESLKLKPLQLLQDQLRPKLSRLQEHMELIAKHHFLQRQSALENLKSTLRLLGPEQTLKRGFSITRKDGESLRSSALLKLGDLLETQLEQGIIISQIIKIKEDGPKGE